MPPEVTNATGSLSSEEKKEESVDSPAVSNATGSSSSEEKKEESVDSPEVTNATGSLSSEEKKEESVDSPEVTNATGSSSSEEKKEKSEESEKRADAAGVVGFDGAEAHGGAEGAEGAEAVGAEAVGAEAVGVDAERKEVKVRAKRPARAATKKKELKSEPKVAVYAPEVQAKINANKDKLAAMVGELQQLEGVADYCDVRLCVQQAEDALFALATGAAVEGAGEEVGVDAVEGVKPVEGVEGEEGVEGVDESVMDVTTVDVASSSTDLVPDTPVESAEPALGDRLSSLVGAVIARSVQGSTAPLKELVGEVEPVLAQLMQRIKEASAASAASISSASSSSSEDPLPAPEGDEPTPAEQALVALGRLCDPVLLSEEIKTLAERKEYGTRAAGASMFADADALAVWRWEALRTQYFDKEAQGVMREVRGVRRLYSRSLKSISKVVEQFLKVPLVPAKVAGLEEKAAKCAVEVEKAKQKRRELEAKRVADGEERRRREEGREQKKVEKGEAEKLRKAGVEAAAGVRVAAALAEKERKAAPSEKEQKEQKARLATEKSKNIFMNFLKKAPAPCVSVPSGHSGSSSTPAREVPVVDLVAEERSLEKFEAAMAAGMTIAEIMADHRERNRLRVERLRLEAVGKAVRPRTIKLMVAVRVPDPRARTTAFGGEDNTYTEIQEREFDNKIRTLSFYEDHRPAYVGTISKKSLIISGRRPFAKDTELLNYDYDSEEDWEEEVEGEDLNNSDEEEEEGGNELEYDDFFCRDDDYGSDGDQDMGMSSAVVHGNKIEVVGLRFINAPVVMAFTPTPSSTPALSESLDPVMTAKKPTYAVMEGGVWVLKPVGDDHDANVLMKYCAVAFPFHPPPYLGRVEVPEVEKEDKEPKARGFDETKLANLVQFVHGKKDGSDKLVAAFHAQTAIAKSQIKKRLLEITDKSKSAEGHGTARWIVKREVLEQLGMLGTGADQEMQGVVAQGAQGVQGLEEVQFTPPKKKKRIVATLVATTLEELNALNPASGAFAPASASAPVSASASAPVSASAAAPVSASSAASASATVDVDEDVSAPVPGASPVPKSASIATALAKSAKRITPTCISAAGAPALSSGAEAKGAFSAPTAPTAPVAVATPSALRAPVTTPAHPSAAVPTITGKKRGPKPKPGSVSHKKKKVESGPVHVGTGRLFEKAAAKAPSSASASSSAEKPKPVNKITAFLVGAKPVVAHKVPVAAVAPVAGEGLGMSAAPEVVVVDLC